MNANGNNVPAVWSLDGTGSVNPQGRQHRSGAARFRWALRFCPGRLLVRFGAGGRKTAPDGLFQDAEWKGTV
ncbi:MAG: hypothetical protein NTX27_02535 [Verrucomicrobia bacterium]|nr:hypothetical protein [Verrucomicrobiota bacterium]